MPEIASPLGAFDKLKDLIMKLMPLFGAAVGILALNFIGRPLATIIKNLLITKLGVKEGTAGVLNNADFTELLWWVPTGVILGSIAVFIGSFVKGVGGALGDAAGNFIIGIGLGFLIGGLIIPFSEDIGLGFLKGV